MTPPFMITSASTSVSSLVDGEEQPELRTSRESLLSLKSRRPRWRKSGSGESGVVFKGSSSSLSLLGDSDDEDKELRTEVSLSLSLPQSAKDGFE